MGEVLLLFGFGSTFCAAGAGFGVTSETRRVFCSILRTCGLNLDFVGSVTTGLLISSSSWKSQMVLDSSGAVTLRPSFPFSSGRVLRPNALLYVVTRLLRERPAPLGVAIIVLGLGWRSLLMGVVVELGFGCNRTYS